MSEARDRVLRVRIVTMVWLVAAAIGAALPAAAQVPQPPPLPTVPWYSPDAPNSAFKRYESAHYAIVTDVHPDRARRILAGIEGNFVAYEEVLGELLRPAENETEADDKPPTKHRIWVFREYDDFLRYLRDAWKDRSRRRSFCYKHTADDRRESITFIKPRESFFESLRHEGFHQVFRSRVAWPPQWLNEGIAEYLEAGRVKGRAFESRLHKGWARQFVDFIGEGKRYNDVSVRELLQMPKSDWLKQSGATYAASWALLHVLRHELDGGREVLARYLAALRDEATRPQNTTQAFAAVFGDEAGQKLLERLSVAYREFVADIKPTERFEDFTIGIDLVRKKDFAGALKRFDEVIAADDAFYPALYFRAIAHSNLEHHRRALLDCLRARTLFPEYYSALWLGARSAKEVGAIDVARALALEAARHASSDSRRKGLLRWAGALPTDAPPLDPEVRIPPLDDWAPPAAKESR
jgi:hypothetical protein